nr:MAG TPA: hypothetical protein [Caudoviricetes sp.]
MQHYIFSVIFFNCSNSLPIALIKSSCLPKSLI